MSEYIVNFGDDKSSAFVRLAMAEVACHGAKLREEIVRCRDCRHFKKGEEEQPIDWCGYFHDEVTPLGFCAWGERVSE